ncbi:MAG: DUF5711 family protein [Bacteroides sp.]|nr:DUF5711 family protein [Eubacterium sp.]MCM1418064.1 DUF5711 family protein [Roseburia sp.]MCM1462208.1 DUF5711 family protein [Bacteroides sp.]
MKILGEIKPTEMETKKSTTAKTVNLTKYRKKKNRTKRLLKLALFLVLAAVFLYVWFNADRIFEPLRGIASKIETRTSNEVGFPIDLPGSASYSFERFGENFSLLTDTYLYAYETTGRQIYALRHGYSNPAQKTSDRCILLYDKAAYSFAVYNKTSLIFEQTVDDKIVYGTIGENDMTAIVTNSPRYSNIIYVYDSGGNWKYTRKLADENVMQVDFAGNDRLIVSTVSVDSGEIVTNYYCFSIRSTEGYEWKYSFKGNTISFGMYADSDRVVSVCDNRVLSLDTSNGELLGEYGFEGELRDFEITANRTAIYYNDVSANRNLIVLLDEELLPTGSYSVTAAVRRLIPEGDRLYVLDGTRLKIFAPDLEGGQRSISLTEDYTDFIKIDDSVYLLGYDAVAEERIE